MKYALGYIAIPILLSIGVCVYSLMNNESDLSSLLSLFIYGALFYSAPYLIWAFVHFVAKPSPLVTHAGYIGATLALAFIASIWLLPSDPSGLPIQWMAYWPLAPVFMTVTVGSAYLFNTWRNS